MKKIQGIKHLALAFVLVFASALWAESAAEIVKKADQFFERGNFEKAVALYGLAQRTGGESEAIYGGLARCYTRLHEKAPEHAFFNWDLFLSETDPAGAAEALDDIYAYWKDICPEQVMEIYEGYLSKVRDSENSYDTYLYRMALLYESAGEPRKAEEYLKEVVDYYGERELRNKSMEGLYRLAMKKEDYEEAEKWLDRLPDSDENLLNRAELLLAKKERLAALAIFEQLAVTGSDQEKQGKLQRILELQLELRLRDRAMETIRSIRAMDLPVPPGVRLEEARIWHYDRHSFLMTEDGKYINSYEHFRKAEDLYKSMLSDFEDSPLVIKTVRLELSRLYLELFDYNKAEVHLRELMSEFRDSPEAEIARELIRKIK